MGTPPQANSDAAQAELRELRAGGQPALAQLFDRYRDERFAWPLRFW
jgi:hypothetical protein